MGIGLGFDRRYTHFDHAAASESYRRHLSDRDWYTGFDPEAMKLMTLNKEGYGGIRDFDGLSR